MQPENEQSLKTTKIVKITAKCEKRREQYSQYED
jgi:hypothetical protein